MMRTAVLRLVGLFLLQSLIVVTVNGDCAAELGECTKECGGGVFELDDQEPCNVHSCDPTTDGTPIGKDIVVAIDMATTFGEKAFCIAQNYIMSALRAYKKLVSAAVAKDTNLSFIAFDKASNLWIPLGRYTLDDLDAFENEFKEIPHDPELKGSMAVTALTAARVTFQADSDLRRPRALLMFADGVTSQGSLLDDLSKLLVEEGINMMVVGMHAKKDCDSKNLLRMANGNQDSLFDACDPSNAEEIIADVIEALVQIKDSPLSCEVTSETDCNCATSSLMENIECTYLGQQHKQFVTKHCSCGCGGGPNVGANGGVYTRWGRTGCPDDSQLVYKGIVAGSLYAHLGGGANYLCMVRKPVYGGYLDRNSFATVYGAEYQMPGNLPFTFNQGNLHDRDVPCAVCHTPQPKVVMIPGTNVCQDGWTKEYTGYLMAGHYGHVGRTEFVCMDGEPQGSWKDVANEDGALFYLAQGVCGSLPCGPYVDKRELTCVVCSK